MHIVICYLSKKSCCQQMERGTVMHLHQERTVASGPVLHSVHICHLGHILSMFWCLMWTLTTACDVHLHDFRHCTAVFWMQNYMNKQNPDVPNKFLYGCMFIRLKAKSRLS